MIELREKIAAAIRGGMVIGSEYEIGGEGPTHYVRNELEVADEILALIQKEQGWRDISSAPRDGTDILVFCEDSGEQFVGFNNPAEGSDREDVFFTALLKGGKRVGCIPSNWMPLPTPPQGEDGPAAQEQGDE